MEKVKNIFKALFASIGTGLLIFASIGIYVAVCFFLIYKLGLIWTLVIIFLIGVLIDFLSRLKKK